MQAVSTDYWRTRPRAPATGTVLGPLAEIAVGAAREYVFGQGPSAFRMFVVRLDGDDLRGYLNLCPHYSLPLNKAPHDFLSADGQALLCSRHFALFRKDDGLCTSGACDGERLDPVPVSLEGGMLVIG